jgi:arginine decarboxylase
MRYLDQALETYGKSDVYPFHMPGHKRKVDWISDVYDIDITEIDGFDNLHHAEGILKEAQQRAADLYGSKHCYYLVNGSTCGILASICAAVGKRGKILVARNSHKAVYHALFLSELVAEYLYPAVTECGIQGQITPQQVEDALKSDQEIAAVVITSPTYEGIISDIEGIAGIVHAYGIPLIVDSAHGAHLGFGGEFPENATWGGCCDREPA